MSLIIDSFLNSLTSSTQVVTINNTGALALPKGVTSGSGVGRPGSPTSGMLRYNTDIDNMEVYTQANGWTPVVGGSSSGNTNDALAYAIMFGA